MVFNYSNAIANLTSGNITGAIVQTYTVSLGTYAWFLCAFATVMMMYIKTQNVGMTAITMMLWGIVAKAYLGGTGDVLFYVITALCITVVLVKLWRG